tara:strand:- start:417 stop:1820 length:1404 start_codon:yes stop_codon:yes gene_type:complete
MDMKVQKATGDSYGLYFALLNLSAILNVLLDLGISNYNNRKIAAHPERFKNYFSSITVIRFSLAILFTIVIQLVGALFGYSSDQLFLLFILGMNQVLLSSILYIRSNYTALGQFKIDSFFSVFDRILMISGVGWLIYAAGAITIEKFIWIQFFGYLITFLASTLVLLLVGKASLPHLNVRFSKVLIRKSAPYAMIVLLMSAYNYSDSIMIERLLSDGIKENALYAQSFRILTALNNYAYLFAVLLLPIFSRMLKRKEAVGKLLNLSGGLLIYGVSAFVIITIHYRMDILSACYGDYGLNNNFFSGEILLNKENIIHSQKIYTVLILGIIPMSFNYCYGVLITASGKMGILNKIATVSLLLNLILNVMLIPKYGAYGAAYASLITQSFSAIAQLLIAYKTFKISFELLKPTRFLLGLSFLYFAIDNLDYLLSLQLRLLVIGVLTILGLLISVKFTGFLGLIRGLKKSN